MSILQESHQITQQTYKCTMKILLVIVICILPTSIFASNSLSIKTNILLIFLTILSIILLTFYHQELPHPLNNYIFSNHYYYSVPLALIIALIFLSFFVSVAMGCGDEA